MLYVIGILLKVIGILLLTVLLLLLFLVGAVLFVPLRYRINAKKEDEIQISVKVHWLLRILFFGFFFDGEHTRSYLKLFGFRIYDSCNPKAPKKVKNKRKTKKTTKEKTKNKIKNKTKSKDKSKDSTTSENSAQVDSELESSNEKQLLCDLNQESSVNAPLESESQPCIPSSDKEQQDEFSSRKKQWFFLRFIENMKRWFQHLIQGVKKAWEGLLNGVHKLSSLIEKIKKVKEFLFDDEQKIAFQMIWLRIKKVVKIVLPQKIRADLHFGTGDPYTTGQILAILGVIYPLYANKLTIRPDFEEQVLEGHLLAVGRIRLVSFLYIAIPFIKDEKIKQLKRNFEGLKEEL